MRYYKLILLFGLFAWTLTSCNTDDLEKDINALNDRVVSMETQVKQLNDEMNIIRVLLDGNKTITDYSIDGDTYTLTLSNGEKLTLTPGVVGGNYPSIEIGDNGNWLIGGKDTGWRAEAENGTDATITPQFKIEANPADGNKKYWWASYDNGTTWTVLENGLAEGTNTNANPISAAVVDGDNFKVTLNGQIYYIPIVKSLECAINAPESITGGFWTVAAGGTSSFTVKVNLAEGDLVRVNAPAAWNAQLSRYAAGTTEVTVTVTPPSTPSECVIIVEVTHGVNTATDQIKAKTTSDSYWAEYQAGFDIKIGDVAINKYDNPDGRLVKNGESISGKGVYFIAEGATVNWSGPTSNLILVSEKKTNDYSSKVAVKAPISLGNEASGMGLLCKGIHWLPDGLTNYLFNGSGNPIERLYLDHCKLEFAKDKPFTYFNNAAFKIANLLVESCNIAIPAPTTATSTINFVNYNVGDYGSVKIRNNIFYSTTANRSVLVIGLTKGGNATIQNVSMDNNTMLNISANHGTTSGFMKVPLMSGWTVKSNLFWYDTDQASAGASNQWLSTLMASAAPSYVVNETDLANNRVFTAKEGAQLIWKIFRTPPTGFKNNDVAPETVSPFVDGTLVATEGKYTLKPEYQGIGATIK